jgi:hypothetical protein
LSVAHPVDPKDPEDEGPVELKEVKIKADKDEEESSVVDDGNSLI